MKVNVRFSLKTCELFSLSFGEQSIAIAAFIQIILVFLKQNFKFFHEQSTNQFIFSLFELVKFAQIKFFGHFPNNLRVYATHVNLNFYYFVYISHKEIHALVDQLVDF